MKERNVGSETRFSCNFAFFSRLLDWIVLIIGSTVLISFFSHLCRKTNTEGGKTQGLGPRNNVRFQKIFIPLPWMVLLIRPPPPPRNFCSRRVMYNPPPTPQEFLIHGLNLPYLEIIDRVPLKINCSYLKTHFFYNLWPICNLLQGNMYFLRR